MKIARNTSYGWIEAITITDLPVPNIKDNEILVKVAYSSVNRTDLGFLKGKPWAARALTGLFKPRYPSLGCEFSGVVVGVGRTVAEFAVGDRVFGLDSTNFGGHAEYKIIDANKMIATVPDGASLADAAIATEGSCYALGFMDKVALTESDTVFVHGATGAIGSAMVQLLAARGVRVVASSTTECVEVVKTLGAAEVIDWQATPLASLAGRYDYFFDAVGKSSLREVRKLIKPGGAYISSELGKSWQNVWLSIFNPILRHLTKRNVLFPIPSSDKQLIEEISRHLSAKTFTPLFDREYALANIKDAYEYVATGHKKGNVRIKVAGEHVRFAETKSTEL